MKRPAASEEAASTRRLLACAWTGPVGVSKVFINPALAVGTLIQFKGAMRVGDLWALGNTLSEPLAWSVFFWVVCPLKGLRPSPALTCPALALCPAPAPPAPPAAPPATPALLPCPVLALRAALTACCLLSPCVERPAQAARTHNPTPIHLSCAWSLIYLTAKGSREQESPP